MEERVWMWLVALALAGTEPSDIVASRDVAAAPEVVFAKVTDPVAMQKLFPEACAMKWVLSPLPAGIGARYRVTYVAKPMKRRLTATVTKAEGSRLVEWDHAGNRGFITRFTIAARDGGSSVTMASFLNPPPWPFKKTYTRKVQPAWQTCYGGVLERLDR